MERSADIPDVFKYTDFRTYLKDCLSFLKGRDKEFSFSLNIFFLCQAKLIALLCFVVYDLIHQLSNHKYPKTALFTDGNIPF